MNWYIEVIKKYAVFGGRARRAEYWNFVLFNFIISVLLTLLDKPIGTQSHSGVGLLGSLYNLAVLLPSLAVTIRRLHDTSRSGWWILINLIPFVGWIIMLVYMVEDSKAGDNQYGPNPKTDLVKTG